MRSPAGGRIATMAPDTEGTQTAMPRHADQEQEFAPLPSGWVERAAALVDSFVSPRSLAPQEATCLKHFSHLCLRYAFMERAVQGELLCQIPTHFSVLSQQTGGDVLEEAEALAAAERESLQVADGPIEDLTELLDDRGIKVIEWPPPTGILSGAFLFVEDTGPALLSLAPAGSPAGRLILAHEYCHLLADIDPYESRFCPLGNGGGSDAGGCGGRLIEELSSDDPADEIVLPEVRADVFARCFLLPRDHLVQSLREFGLRRSAGFPLERLGHVAYYYDVNLPTLIHRLVDLELLAPSRSREMVAAIPQHAAAGGPSGDAVSRSQQREREDAASVDDTDHEPDPLKILGRLPRRFVDLALALLLKRRVSLEQFGVLLDTKPQAAARLLGWLQPPEEEKPKNST
jgi:Zn-dependent peptidase ImmA (M78 family)